MTLKELLVMVLSKTLRAISCARIFGSLFLLVLILSSGIVTSIKIAGAVDSGANSRIAASAFRDCSNCPEMMVIPSGEFVMGTVAAASAQILQSMSTWDT